jgi:hypothetical protein
MYRYIYIDIYIYNIYIYVAVSNRKRKGKPRWLSLIHLPFARHANGSLLSVRLVTKKQTEVICLQMDKTDCPIYDGLLLVISGF